MSAGAARRTRLFRLIRVDIFGRRARVADGAMAKIIEFYVPNSFKKNQKWIPAEKRGRVIEFATRKTA